MLTREAQSTGGKIMAKRQREEAIRKYYANPKICKHCHLPIPINQCDKVCTVRKKVFCNSSCSTKYYNMKRANKKRTYTTKPCTLCGREMSASSKSICRKCYNKTIGIGDETKGSLFSRRSGYQSARSAIRKHANSVFVQNNFLQSCHICGYSLHIDICHIRAVTDFPDSSTISEINDPSNLVGLCPTHHWEFDNGFLTLS